MRKSIISIFIASIATSLSAQTGYFSFGYNGNMFQSEKLDFVIDRYNETRTFLDVTMEYPHYLDGFDIHAGGGKQVIFDFGFSWRSSYVHASGVDASGINQQRDLKYKFGAFDIALAVNVTGDAETKLAIGYNQTLGSEKVYSRVAPVEEVENTDYEKMLIDFNPGGDVFLQLLLPFSGSGGLIIKPYYHFSYGKTDYAPLNNTLNPATAGADDPVLESRLGGFGASIMLAVGNFD